MGQTVKIMPDYGCSPIWIYQNGDLVSNPELDSLPWPPDLICLLKSWDKRFQDTLNQDDPVESGFPTAMARQAFSQEGQQLCDRIRVVLGPDYRVVYHSIEIGQIVEGQTKQD